MKFLKIDARSILRVLLGLFLIFPFIIWIWQITAWRWPDAGDWLPVLALSVRQAFFSALMSLVAGFLLFIGLQGWTSPRARKLAEFGLLLPNMMPSLFLALGLLNLVTPFAAFPFGLGAVILAHVLLNAGLVSISLDRLVFAKLGGMAETAWIMGSGRARFWKDIGFPFLKGDLASLFLFVFGVCFTSFSLPLLLSGGSSVTLEVAIYDAIRVEGRWDKAVLLAMLQTLTLFFLALLLPQPFWPPRPARQSLQFLNLRGSRIFVFAPALVIVMGWMAGLADGFHFAFSAGVFIEALLTTLLLSVAVGVLTFILFLLIAYVSPHPGLKQFLNGYLAPSPVITGFALLFIPVESEDWNLLKTVCALTLISLPVLYRWTVHSSLDAVKGQVRTARLLGASWAAILSEVVWPQTARDILRASGLAALWASGDFALTGIFLSSSKTLPLLMRDLIGNYRMDSAQWLMIPLVLVGLGVYFLFTMAGRYVSR